MTRPSRKGRALFFMLRDKIKSVETTRLYIITAGIEHLRQLDKMKLVM